MRPYYLLPPALSAAHPAAPHPLCRALFRQRLSLGSSGRGAAGGGTPSGVAAAASPLIDITASATNQHLNAAGNGPSVQCHVPGALAIADQQPQQAEGSAGSIEGWEDGDDDEAANWDLLGDLDVDPLPPAAALPAAKVPSAAAAATAAAGPAEGMPWAEEEDAWDSPDQQHQQQAQQRAPQPSTSRRPPAFSTGRRQRLRSLFADEEEDGDGLQLQAAGMQVGGGCC